MNRIILITGDLATGKTTFSKILSRRFSVEVYNKDTIKEILGDTVGFSNREENLRLSHATVEIMTFLFKSYAPLGHDLILEANFHKKEIVALEEIAKQYDYKVLTLNFVADEKVLYDRFLNRIQNENRHPVHQTAGLNSFEAFCGYIEKSRKDVELKNEITIDATDFTYQTDEELLGKLDGFMK